MELQYNRLDAENKVMHERLSQNGSGTNVKAGLARGNEQRPEDLTVTSPCI